MFFNTAGTIVLKENLRCTEYQAVTAEANGYTAAKSKRSQSPANPQMCAVFSRPHMQPSILRNIDGCICSRQYFFDGCTCSRQYCIILTAAYAAVKNTIGQNERPHMQPSILRNIDGCICDRLKLRAVGKCTAAYVAVNITHF